MTIHISSDAFYTFSPQRNSPLPTTFETLLLRKKIVPDSKRVTSYPY